MIDAKEEIWKDIVGYEGMYMVSNLGNVKSVARIVKCNKGKREMNGVIRTLRISNNGYPIVSIRKSIYTIHRLLAIAFIPNPENKPVVNHKDGNKLNNNVNNLEWCTHSDNIKHAFKMGLKMPSKTQLGKKGGNHNKAIPVLQFNKNGEFVKEYPSLTDASIETGVPMKNISLTLHNYQKTSGGFIWKKK